MNRQRRLLPTLLVWAMLPLTVLSGSPRTACLCSNGDVKLFCHSAQARRSCCVDNGQCETGSPRDSWQQHSCCRAPGSPPKSPASYIVAGCHCTPVVVLPDAVSKVEPTTAPDFEVAIHHLSDDVASVIQWTSADFVGFHPSSPGEARDLVILLSRMLA